MAPDTKVKTSQDVTHSLLDCFAVLVDYMSYCSLLVDPISQDEGRGTLNQTSWISQNSYLKHQERTSFSPVQHSWLQDFFSSSNAKEDQTNQMDRYLRDIALNTNSAKAGGGAAPASPWVITSLYYTRFPFLESFLAFSTNCDAVIGTA